MEVNGDPEVTRYLPYDTWHSSDVGNAWFERMTALDATGTGQQLVVVRNATGKAIGTVLLFRYDGASARAEIVYVLGRSHWRLGLMREALQAVVAHCILDLALRRLEAEVNIVNETSNIVLQRLGFTCEGKLRQRWVAKGQPYDTNLYGLLGEDWSAEPPRE